MRKKCKKNTRFLKNIKNFQIKKKIDTCQSFLLWLTLCIEFLFLASQMSLFYVPSQSQVAPQELILLLFDFALLGLSLGLFLLASHFLRLLHTCGFALFDKFFHARIVLVK